MTQTNEPRHSGASEAPLSLERVESLARGFAQVLFDDYHILRKIVDRHEETLRKRWAKKSIQQKKKILQTAWPEIPLQHRPDILTWKQQSRERDASWWPQINLEDLTKTQNMLIFLHARGRHQPHEFLYADLRRDFLGEQSGLVTMRDFKGHIMIFHGRDDPKSYGDVVPWNCDTRGRKLNESEMGMQPGHGLQVLNIQQRIYIFLVKWCQVLTHDIADLTQGDVVPDPGPPNGLSKDKNITSLEIVALEAQYSVPANMDFPR